MDYLRYCFRPFWKINSPFFLRREIRECLKLDPEHKFCFPHYKKVKKIEKLMSDCEEAVNSKDYGMCAEKAKKVCKISNFIYYELLFDRYSHVSQIYDEKNQYFNN